MARAEEHRVETTDINGTSVTITSYRIEDRYHCHVANVDYEEISVVEMSISLDHGPNTCCAFFSE